MKDTDSWTQFPPKSLRALTQGRRMDDSHALCITLSQFGRTILYTIRCLLWDFICIIFSSQTFSYPRSNYQRDLSSVLTGLGTQTRRLSSTFPDRDEDKAAPKEPESIWITTPSSQSSNTAITLTALSPDCPLAKAEEPPFLLMKEWICPRLHQRTSPSQGRSLMVWVSVQMPSSAQISCKSMCGSPYTNLCSLLEPCRVEDWIGISL